VTAVLVFRSTKTRCQRTALLEHGKRVQVATAGRGTPLQRVCTLAGSHASQSSAGAPAEIPAKELQRRSQQAAEPSIGRGIRSAATNVSLASSRMWWLYAKQRYPFPARRLHAAAAS